ncbi:MAG: TonB-dependent receptor, partial [Desulfoplanes sp.]
MNLKAVLKKGRSVAVAVAVWGLCQMAAFAAAEDELAYLKLFYDPDELVVTATRYPRPVSEVPENMEIITAEEIEKMNAHTVAEVINTVPGLYVQFCGRGFGSLSQFYVQGSDSTHVRVMIDGVTLNSRSSGIAETDFIPVAVIDRIEIVKGPASSVWGSSLGGVINLITKRPAPSGETEGAFSASYGERHTQDYRAQMSGKIGGVGIYGFAGHQASDGIKNNRWFESTPLYSKLTLALSPDWTAGLSAAYSAPEQNQGDFPSYGLSAPMDFCHFFITAFADGQLLPNVKLTLSGNQYRYKQNMYYNLLSIDQTVIDSSYDENSESVSAILTWEVAANCLMLGAEFESAQLDQAETRFSLTRSTSPEVEEWALFVNDTLDLGRVTLNLGLRYDHDSLTGDFVSPSLGVAVALNEDSVLRLTASRGYNRPNLSWVSGGGWFFDPNPDLDRETVWSCQAGFETRAIDYLRIKATAFYHALDDEIQYVSPSGSSNGYWINSGDVRRQGVELEAGTAPVHHVSVSVGGVYTRIKSDNESRALDRYVFNTGIYYDDKTSMNAGLTGHFIYWDEQDSAFD